MKNYFTVAELCRSDTATKHNINNTPGTRELHNLETITIPQLNIIREFLGIPLIVNSGYRNKELNRKVKGVITSKHLEGLATDVVPKGMTTKEIWEKLKNSKYSSMIDQCILYRNKGFVHIGFTDGIPRQQFFIK